MTMGSAITKDPKRTAIFWCQKVSFDGIFAIKANSFLTKLDTMTPP